MTIKKRLLSLTFMILILLTSFANTTAIEYKLINSEESVENAEIIEIKESYLKDIQKIKLNGKQVFDDISDIVRFSISDKDFSYIQKLAENGYSAREISKYSQLDISTEEIINFKDTKKPNCVFIYPKRDKENAFDEKKAIEFFNKISSEYDVYVLFAETEKDVYNALNKIQNIELLIIAGHGTYQSISLGENDLRIEKAEFDERYVLDIYDYELKYHLDNLNKNATIFLYACSTGKDRENLAESINEITNVKVISAKDTFFSSDIEIVSVYPFDIKIIKNGEDITNISETKEKAINLEKKRFDVFGNIFRIIGF